jgi:hypothetical protein
MKSVFFKLRTLGLCVGLGLGLMSCSSWTLDRSPAFSEFSREPDRMIPGREAYSGLPQFSELKTQISEIGVLHSEESEISSWKFECLNQQAHILYGLLQEDRSSLRKKFEALHVVGVEFLLADLSEHGASSDRPSVRLLWWEDSDQRGLLVRVVYDPQNPTPELRCRILKSSVLERQILQLK